MDNEIKETINQIDIKTKEYFVWDSDILYGVDYDAGTWK